MTTLVIDREVMAQAAAATGMTEPQLQAWFRAHYDTIRAIRLYIQSRGTTEPSYIEQYADPNGPLDPTLVAQVIELLEIGGLITRLEA